VLTNDRIQRGRLGEDVAARHLVGCGYRILARNYRTRSGELDLVVADPRYLVFCEVKTRVAGTRAGPVGALEAIGAVKRRQVRAMAREWLAGRPRGAIGLADELRFDAIGVTINAAGGLLALEHIEDAF